VSTLNASHQNKHNTLLPLSFTVEFLAIVIVMLLSNPADLTTWRQRLFSLDNEVKLFPGEFEEIWPYVTNFWSRQIIGKHTRDNPTQRIDTYYCRLFRKQQMSSKGQGLRKKGIRVAPQCGMKLQLTEQYSPDRVLQYVTVTRFGPCQEHNHTLEYMDEIKRNQKLMDIAGHEVSNGYQYAAIARTMTGRLRPEAEQALIDAGGLFFDRQDVKNAGRHWKRKNPDPRFVGANYPIKQQVSEATEWLDDQPGRRIICLLVRIL
jgi:hypothetical protein